MFTSEERQAVRERVLSLAREDARASGGAVTGSGAVGDEDRWSDVDTSFGIVDGVEPLEVLEDWTRTLDAELGFVHWWDLRHAGTIYRVFLLPSSLELDIAVTPAAQWVPRGPRFELVFGETGEPEEAPPPALDEIVGAGWLAALVVRMAIARGRTMQAVLFVNTLRDQTLALACIRHGQAHAYARGAHLLPAEETEAFAPTLVRSLERDELQRALAAATSLFLAEIDRHDAPLAGRLRSTLADLVESG